MGFHGFCLVAGLVITLSGVTAMAADSAWTGSTDALWATITSWNPGTPASGDVAVFDGGGGGNTPIDLGGGGDCGVAAIGQVFAATVSRPR